MRILVNLHSGNKYYYLINDSYITKCYNSETFYFDKKRICEYIEKSNFFIVMLDTTDCIICGENILHYDTLITDGDWVWSADLKHYFDHHNFVFPEDFLQSIRSKNYEISEISTSFGEELCERFNFFSENDLSDFEVRRLW